MENGLKLSLSDTIKSLVQERENLSNKVDELNKENMRLSNELEKLTEHNDSPNVLARVGIELLYNSHGSIHKDSHLYTLPDVSDHSLNDSNII